jgi:dihydrodipicolinate synthase/N-acetylneuraminate lyase
LPNFAPDLDLKIYKALERKDYIKAKGIQLRLTALARLIREIGSLTVVKEAMNMMGMARGSFRPPAFPATAAERNRTRETLMELRLL